MRKPAIALYSLGCAKNLVDSERALAQFGMHNAVLTSDVTEADCVIVNTCTFVREADAESRAAVSEALDAKRNGKCRWVFLVGCMGQRYGERLRQDYGELDGVYGVLDSATVREIIRRLTNKDPGADDVLPQPRLRLTPRHYAYLRISDGCDNRCSYCLIPSVRGPLCSRPIEELVDEARHLCDDGAKELIVVAQDTSNYGTDLYGKRRLPDLLDRLVAVPDIRWIRLLYMHPAHVDAPLIDRLACSERIAPYVDLPIQHISDAVLERMGRKVTCARIRGLIEEIRARVSNVVLRTTLIVGFPGEREQDFDLLERFVRETRFERMGIFAYSREEGTLAHDFGEQISGEVACARRERLLEVQQEIAFSRNRELAGRRLEVVVDRIDEGGIRVARSYAEAPDVDPVIYVGDCDAACGRFLSVRVTGCRGYDLTAIPSKCEEIRA